jgi:hypothetical protein
MKAVLYLAGELETVPLKRPIYQYFGSWEGIRAESPGNNPINIPLAEWPKRTAHQDWGRSEVWLTWKFDALQAYEAIQLAALLPWLLRASMPAWDEVVDRWDADPDGRWIRAIGHATTPPSELEAHIRAHLKAVLGGMIAKDLFDKALNSRNAHISARALYPAKALLPAVQFERPGLNDQGRAEQEKTGDSIVLPTLQQLSEMLNKCMGQDSLAVLVLGAETLNEF